MNEVVTCFKINDRTISIPVRAERFSPGSDEILFEKTYSPVKDSQFKDKGYTIQPFLSFKKNTILREFIKNLVKNALENLQINTAGFELSQYHNYVNDEQHLQFVKEITAGTSGIGGFSTDILPFDVSEIDQRISEICNCPVTTIRNLFVDGKNYKINNFYLRVVRPQQFKDNNPPHRDVHLERNLGAVNLYLPFAGSNLNSSLPILPGSHFWSESQIVRSYGDTYVNSVKYTNPATISSVYGLNLITPNPSIEEVMVFTPYALHGGGYNFNSDVTRVSLEMRFWKKNNS